MNINWHRLFGLLLMDYFSNRGFNVEIERDLSLKRQFLDVLIIEKKEIHVDLSGICDGFDDLGEHNLVTYKSKNQSLNLWAIEELIGHYVNYKKILTGSGEKVRDIRLYAICTRYPRNLLSAVEAEKVSPGVFELRALSRTVKVVVLNFVPLEQKNAVLAFFSFDANKVSFALKNYIWQQEDGSTVINQLLDKYSLEGIDMPYTMEQFRKEYIKAHLHEIDPEERLKGMRAEEIEAYLKRLKEEVWE